MGVKPFPIGNAVASLQIFERIGGATASHDVQKNGATWVAQLSPQFFGLRLGDLSRHFIR